MPLRVFYRVAAAALVASLCAVPSAHAQLAPSGGSFSAVAVGVRGNASAYDSRNNVFLAVGGHGTVTGRLIKPDGTFAGAAFRIDLGTGYPQYPGIAYSPDADSGRGAFLVTWHQNIGPRDNFVHARLVSAAGALLGEQFTLGTEGTWWEVAPMVDYATTSRAFMVTWRTIDYKIRAARVSNTGQGLDAPSGIPVTTSGGERDASVAYNPETDTFLVSWATFFGNAAYSRLVSAATGALGAPQVLGTGAAVYMTDATFSTSAHKYLVGWVQPTGGGRSVATGRFVNADGTPSGSPIPLSTRFGTYDSFGVAYNPVTRSSLIIGQDALSYENGGVEVSDGGLPGLDTVLTNAGPTGNFYPQVSASTLEGKWLVTTAHTFSNLVGQFVVGAVNSAPLAITAHPADKRVKAGNWVSFTASASGSPSPTVMWEASNDGGPWTPQWWATTTTITFQTDRSMTNRRYRARFTNSTGNVVSNAAALKVRPASTDFDGDGRADVVVWDKQSGTWRWVTSGGVTNSLGASGVQWGNKSLGDISLSGDLDGDGIGDLVIWRASDGTWYWLTSSTGYSYGAAGLKQWGSQAQGDVPLLADFDGDGRDDLVIWRASTGNWHWLTSSSGYAYDAAGVKQWGNAALGDVPFAEDLDGDGLADPTVWRASTGTWYWLKSSNGYSYQASGSAQWGNQALVDVPLLGDVDGDGRADLMIWRATTGNWHWLTSSSNYTTGYVVSQWGNASLGDVPLLGDFDGDGTCDIVIYRASTGEWFWLSSGSGFTAIHVSVFGGGNYVPVLK